MPEGEPLSMKFDYNKLAGDPSRDGGRDYVALRICRLNHDCHANAGHNYDDGAHVEILFAQRDIQPGEEICISYFSFSNLNAERAAAGMGGAQAEYQLIQKVLLDKWTIICPSDCICKDPNIHKLIAKGRQLNLKKEILADSCKPQEALECARELLKVQEALQSSLISKANTHHFAFQVAVMTRKTLDQADQHIAAVVDIYKAICPYSRDTTQYEKKMKNPKIDVNYLSMERHGFF